MRELRQVTSLLILADHHHMTAPLHHVGLYIGTFGQHQADDITRLQQSLVTDPFRRSDIQSLRLNVFLVERRNPLAFGNRSYPAAQRTKFQLHGKSSPRGKVQFHPAFAVHDPFLHTVVFCLFVGIDAVNKQRSRITDPFRQEREIQLHIPSIPIGHATHIPVDILLADSHDILAKLTGSDKSRIRLHRQGSNEIHTLLFIQVIGRRITQHRERRIVHNIGSQLMTPGSHAGRSRIHGTPIGLRSVAHRSRSVIHRSRHHTDIGESNIIKRHIILDIRPFHLFHAKHAFKIDNMRVGTVDTCRFVNAVQIKG